MKVTTHQMKTGMENNSKTITTERDEYKFIIDRIQFSMTVIGFLGNIIVYVTLSKNGNMFSSPTILRLLKNQSIVDSLVCLIGSIFVLQPPMWKTSNEKFSAFICQVCKFQGSNNTEITLNFRNSRLSCNFNPNSLENAHPKSLNFVGRTCSNARQKSIK